MNKRLPAHFLLLVLFALSVFSTRLIAAEASGITVHTHLGGIDFDGDLTNDVYRGIGIGYQFDSPWALELMTQSNKTRLTKEAGDASVDSWRVDSLYHLDSNRFIWGDNLRPYLSIGVGRVKYDFKGTDPLTGPPDVKATQFNVGAGFKLDLSQRTSLRIDFRAFHANKDDHMKRSVSLGVHRVFGKKGGEPVRVAEAPRAELERDSDICAESDRSGVRTDDGGCYETVMEMGPVSVSLDLKFDFDQAVVRQESADQVLRVAEFMREYLTTVATLEGHTDSRGSEDYNLALSLRRARAVADMLIGQFGIAEQRLTTKGFGESQPIDTNETKAGRQNNRRVVTTVNAGKEAEIDH